MHFSSICIEKVEFFSVVLFFIKIVTDHAHSIQFKRRLCSINFGNDKTGDYFRYISEIMADPDLHHKAAEDAHESYKQAYNITNFIMAMNFFPEWGVGD